MARFEIKTPVPDFTGLVAGVAFAKGRAVITSDTEAGAAALYYFKGAGYGISALDGVEADEVLSRANEAPGAEHARLVRENTELQNRLDLDELRDRNKALQGEVFKTGDASRGEAPAPVVTQAPLLAPPADGASQAAWRKWAVDSGRVPEDEAKILEKATIQAVHGAAYDEERAARLRADAADGGEQA